MSLSLFQPDTFDLLWERPFRNFERHLMEHQKEKGGRGGALQWRPRCDVKETEGAYVISAEIPGVKKKNVAVELEGNILKISGKVEKEMEEKEEGKVGSKERYYLYERSFGSFSRSFSLPEDADLEKVSAKQENGVLSLEILKKKPEPKERRIEIN